ncbi:MAG: LPS assembly lipoprotein LptE, partial [Planctomycetota bacterium]
MIRSRLPCAAGVSAALTIGGIKTVAVHVFENDTYERDVEFELADALIKEIEARTPYKVTSDKRADTILTGRIRDIERDQLSKSRVTGLSEEVTLGVTI